MIEDKDFWKRMTVHTDLIELVPYAADHPSLIKIEDNIWVIKNFVTPEINKIFTDHAESTDEEDWWKKKLPQSACRFCYGNLIPSSPPSFCSVLAQKDNLTKSIEKIESYNIIQDCVTFFCCECCRFSVVSYEYDCALRSTMGLHTTPTADAYYTRIANIFEKK
jgi:hypothetical protein